MLPGPLPKGSRLFLELFVAVPMGGSGLEASEVPVQNIRWQESVPGTHHVSFLKSCGPGQPFISYVSDTSYACLLYCVWRCFVVMVGGRVESL